MLFRLMRFSFGRPAIWFDADPNPGGGSGGGGGGNPAPQNVTMSQTALDALFAERASHARSAREKEILDAAGVKTVEELQALVTGGKEATTKLTEAEKKAQQAEADKAEILSKTTKRLMDIEIRNEAAKAGFLDEAIPDVLSALDRSKITEEGEAFKGISEAVKALAEAKKHWLKQAGKPQGTPRPGDPPKKTDPQNQNQPVKKVFTL